ncbi:MAG: DUF1844 domain-containing protein [Desulfobulbaceae bacterium]|nr:MAG: DUF1844 domain-containing protein [Desulfobulbaceae bacterium]
MAKILEEKEKSCPEGQIRRDGQCVMPDVTFTTLVISLNTSALMHLGELDDPETGQKGRNLMMAKHAIDTLCLLQKKTSGNLNVRESDLLAGMLYDLRMRYVQLTS